MILELAGNCVLREIVCFWIDSSSICDLDTAFCNTILRNVLLDVLSVKPNRHYMTNDCTYHRTFSVLILKFKFHQNVRGQVVLTSQSRIKLNWIIIRSIFITSLDMSNVDIAKLFDGQTALPLLDNVVTLKVEERYLYATKAWFTARYVTKTDTEEWKAETAALRLANLVHLVTSCPKLVSLELFNCTAVSHESFEKIQSKIPITQQLLTLKLHCLCSNESIVLLVELLSTNCGKLTELTLKDAIVGQRRQMSYYNLRMDSALILLMQNNPHLVDCKVDLGASVSTQLLDTISASSGQLCRLRSTLRCDALPSFLIAVSLFVSSSHNLPSNLQKVVIVDQSGCTRMVYNRQTESLLVQLSNDEDDPAHISYVLALVQAHCHNVNVTVFDYDDIVM